jgi:hypothetical protein
MEFLIYYKQINTRSEDNMSKNKNKRNIPELYRNMEGVIWMVGLAILAIKGWWWPGILILVAISTIYESVLMSAYPKPAEESFEPAGSTPLAASSAPVSQPAPKVEYPTASLPTNCPRCGAPARGHDVHWTSIHSADCAFCGANLPLSK